MWDLLQVVTPGLQVCVPPSVEAGTPAKTPGARPERAAGGLERPDELVPELLRFLQAHPEIKAVPKVVQVRLVVFLGGRGRSFD